jgi:predicted signal transduction protein with EAL and GGDEF domain
MIAEPIVVAGQTLRLTASVGGGADPAGERSLIALLREADLALSEAKAAGQRSWARYAEPMLQESTRKLTLEADLHRAIVTGALDLVYQPMIDLATDRITGVEALCRWRHPRLGPITPTEFIALAEHSGLIEPLTRWELMRACLYGAAWRAQLPLYADLDIAVIISPGSLRGAGFSSVVSDCLAESGLPATNLTLEITETTLAVADPGSALPLIVDSVRQLIARRGKKHRPCRIPSRLREGPEMRRIVERGRDLRWKVSDRSRDDALS